MSEEEFFNRLINKIDKEFGYDVANTLQLMFIKKEKQVEQLEKEIDRLNNIINELEKYIKTEAKIELYKDKNGFRAFADSDDILNKLKELKENNKDE